MRDAAILLFLGTSLFIVGCRPNITAKASKSNAVSDNTTASLGSRDDTRSLDSKPTENFFLLKYCAPSGWPSRPAKIGNGIVMFAPENADWRLIGFRPNLGVKITDNPGMTLDQLETLLRETLASSVEELDAKMFVEAKQVLDVYGHTLTTEDLGFEIRKSELKDGCPCLESQSFGVFNLDGRIIKTKTCSIALVDPAHVYTTTIIIPVSHEKELQRVWDSFRDTLRFGELEPDGR